MKEVNVSIITIGDELLIGQTIDTNSAFIAQELNRIGAWVKRRVAVGDDAGEIRKALDEEAGHSEIIIITGGLGPTADDITKPLLCEYFGGKLVRHDETLEHIHLLFEKVFRKTGPLLERNIKQAEVPDVCEVLFNERGTAPGMVFTKDGRFYYSLPGVPYEMKGLVTGQVLPHLLKHFRFMPIIHKTLITAGTGESVIAEMLVEYESVLPAHIKLAYLPNYGMVKLRLTGKAGSIDTLQQEMDLAFTQLQEIVRDYLVWKDDQPFEIITGTLLLDQGKTVGLVESCTGGYIAQLITSVAGSSKYFKGGIVAYDNEVKKAVVGVNNETLEHHGAVSEETVREMVKGGLAKLKSDYVLATSGIMGPSGGSDQKPVGTVWIAAGNATKTETLQIHLRFDRQRNIVSTAFAAMNFLRKFILANH